MKPAAGAVQHLEQLLGRPLRRYEAFVRELVQAD
jgi:hypothetical protein